MQVMIPLFDSHTHLNEPKLFADRKQYIANFSESWWQALVNVGASREFNQNGIKIANSKHDSEVKIYTTIGFHPYEVIVSNVTEESIATEITLLNEQYQENQNLISAIGEIGIDLHYKNSSDTIWLQKKLFTSQCDLARKLWLPIVVHSRLAFNETLDVLSNYKDLKIYFHCRGYSSAEINILQEEFKNIFIGFCGNLTYPKAEELRESIKATNINNFLLETDAPYLAPQVLRGQQNEPANIQYLYQYTADLLWISSESLAEQLKQNFKFFYGELG